MTGSTFATFLVICPTSFFLGILFTNWVYDHHTLWNSTGASDAIYAAVETHYSMLARAPPILPRTLHAIIFTGLIGFFIKLYRPSESNMLFDGSSLVLFMIGIIMYGTNVIRGLQTVESGDYGEEIGRIDTMRIMAASHVILALVLVGVLVLQSGQYYAERKALQERTKIEEEDKANEKKTKKRN
ncbi:Shr3 amino acid permease chaperone [Pyronema domesticum]|uniref:Similar to Secretory component protein SHR3 acc. no. Q02774 n=1 Tax=Pyronema omphalodes (strain CBS 100304) TaxID=1076935 RepID=U4L887_PYROM|nr:Shr3 amino acid permease chaperone [Pyronema domesticum]CCX13057.1 Similar to Secretory component protein SHR3; acc. no. Q02774 [Pyronema omphalodes CBS 100304]